jgi:hypothetical protein
MALVSAGLQSGLLNLMTTPGATPAAAAALWAAAFGSYAAGVVPTSTTVAAAQATLQIALAAAFALPSATAAMDTAFQAAALTIAGGMAAGGFTGTPPGSVVGWATLLVAPYSATNALAAAKIANRIHAWMLTGTTVLVAPPNTPGVWL